MAQRSITLVINTLKYSFAKVNSTNTFVFRSFFKPAASTGTEEVLSAKRSR